MKNNIYYLIFYILMRFSKVVAPKNYNKEDFADSAQLSLTLSIFIVFLTTILYFNIEPPFLNDKISSLIFGGLLLYLVYYLNGKIFIKNKKYELIQAYYDDAINLNNIQIIIISLTILIGSFSSLFLLVAFKIKLL